jgi:hypothetical protein
MSWWPFDSGIDSFDSHQTFYCVLEGYNPLFVCLNILLLLFFVCELLIFDNNCSCFHFDADWSFLDCNIKNDKYNENISKHYGVTDCS